jgi:heterodisulfide reductase subunit A
MSRLNNGEGFFMSKEAALQEEKIGFYICHCGINISFKVRCQEVAEYIGTMPGVVISRDYLFMCSDPGQEIIENDIKEFGLNRVVVASCSPRMHEHTFRAACARAGLNPFRAFHHVCVREHVSWVTLDEDEATEKARILSKAGINRVRYQSDLFPKTFPVNPDTLIIGGGIAGMQASLDIASAGYTVHLVERQATIGGHMLQYDKTFPTMDCAACIGTPKMVSVGQHPNINILSYSEVEEVSGFVGNFQVKVKKHARYVNSNTCTGCGECTKNCPISVPNEWDVGTLQRKAVYRPFPQAVPITFAIDKRDRGPCVQTCPAGTNVQGYVTLISEGKYQEAVQCIMENLPLPGTLGRICPAPCESVCRRAEVDHPLAIRQLKRFAADMVNWDELPLPDREMKNPDQKVAVVGAGPAGLSCAYFLACDGYPVTVFEASTVVGGMLRMGIPDYRLPPEVLEREIGYIQRLGVDIKLNSPINKTHSIDQLFNEGYKAVYLASGAHKSTMLNIPNEDAEGVVHGVVYLRNLNIDRPTQTGKTVIVIGGGDVAIDAARAAVRKEADSVKIFYRRTRREMPAHEEEVLAAEAEGIQIEFLVAPVEVLKKDGRITGLRCQRMELGEPDASGRRRPVPIEGSEFSASCDMLIPAIGQKVDIAVLEGTEGVELSERGTIVVDQKTYETTLTGLFAGGDMYTGPSIAIEAVAAGKEAAYSIKCCLNGKDMVANRPERPSGEYWAPIPDDIRKMNRAEMSELEANKRRTGFDEVEMGFSEEEARAEASRCLECGVCCECKLCVSSCEANAIEHDQKDEVVTLDVGSIIVATGFDIMDPTPLEPYGYSKFPNVLTSLEFERLSNATGPTSGKILLRDPDDRWGHTSPPQSVAFLHCIGSRDKHYHEYCSRTCCMYALKMAHLVKDKCGHETQVYNFYIDMRCFGKGYEEFYCRIQNEGVRMIRGKAVEVTDKAEDSSEEGLLIVRAEDTLTGKMLRVPVEMVVLCTAMEPRPDALDVARIFGLSLSNDGFFMEEHPKLEPVSTPTSGVFLAGACQGPKDITDSVGQAKAAASEAQALSTRGEVVVLPMISNIDKDVCIGCQVCIDLCVYGAIEFDELRGISVVNEAVCKGCGSCAAYCPSGAAGIRHFTQKQIFGEIEGILAV